MENKLALPNSVITKSEEDNFAYDIVKLVKDGDICALKTKILLKCLSDIIKLVSDNDDFKECLEDEYGKYQEKTFKAYGVEIEKSQKPTYDYNVCKDEAYDKLIKKKKELDVEIKSREKYLKGLDNNDDLDTTANDGFFEVKRDPKKSKGIPPVKKVTSFIKIKLNK